MIVITGGAGFIGSNLIAALRTHAPQEPLVVCDVFGQEDKWQNLKHHLIYDIIPPHELLTFLDQNNSTIKAIVHMGAISTTTERNVDLIIQNNFILSKNLFDWCARHRDKKVRFFYASSAATYGNGQEGFSDSYASGDLARLKPLNAYGWSKHAFDRYVAFQHESGGLVPSQWVGFKFFNVYGPNEYHKGLQTSVVFQIYHKIKDAKGIARLFKGPPVPERDFIYVKDCEKIFLWFYNMPTISGIFNVGTGEARTFQDLATAVFKALGQGPRIEEIDMPKELAGKYQYHTQADIGRLHVAGYNYPFRSLEEGVADYVKTYLTQTDPYR